MNKTKKRTNCNDKKTKKKHLRCHSREIFKILNYWFSSKHDNMKRWFHSGNKYDKEIKTKFHSILKKGENGKLEHWACSKNGYLAYIILMDQFTRHIYRGTSKAYKYDNKTVKFMEQYLDKYLDSYNSNEKMFILMPYQHSENIKNQIKGCQILNLLIEKENNIHEKKILQHALKHQIGHYEVIKKFGRFPKRNIFLNRESTTNEKNYIASSKNLPY